MTVHNPAIDDVLTQVEFAPKAEEFCRENKLKPYVNLACHLISDLFVASGHTLVHKEEDPEFKEEWVSISVRVSGNADAVAAAYDEYSRRWSAQVPSEVIGKVRLSIGAA
jgi:hypothetical protein